MKQFSFYLLVIPIIICITISFGLTADPGDKFPSESSQTLDSGLYLPQWETPQESLMRLLTGWTAPSPEQPTPPTGDPRRPAEFEAMNGLLIRYPWSSSYNSIYQAIITDTLAEDAVVHIACEPGNQSSLESWLTSNGFSLQEAEIIVVDTDTIWMRDYGPEFIYVDDTEAGIVDMIYDRYGRVQDDAFPGHLGDDFWYIDVYDPDLKLEGGNLMMDGCGTCMTSDRIFEQNPTKTYEDLAQIMYDYFGCTRFYTLQRQIGDGTGHIDMFAKFLDPDTILLAQFNPGDQNYQAMEDNAAYLATLQTCTGGSYNIVRIFTESNFRTYTNSQFMNNTIMVAVWGLAYDSTALSIYQGALPGYNVASINVSVMAGTGGAIHCIVHEVPNGPYLDVSNLYFDFGDTQTEDTFDLTNSGGGTLTWTISCDACWLSTVPISGSTIDEADQITINVERSCVPLGLYTGYVTIDSNGGSKVIQVDMIQPDVPVEIFDFAAAAQ